MIGSSAYTIVSHVGILSSVPNQFSVFIFQSSARGTVVNGLGGRKVLMDFNYDGPYNTVKTDPPMRLRSPPQLFPSRRCFGMDSFGKIPYCTHSLKTIFFLNFYLAFFALF